MRKTSFLTVLFAVILSAPVYSLAQAETQPSDCANLSFVKYAYGTPWRYEQKECSGFDVYQVVEESKIFVTTIRFEDSWREEQENSDYEFGLRRQRWKWSHDRKKIIQEFVFDMHLKASGDEYFTVGSIVFSVADGKVAENGARHVRVEKLDGTTEVKSIPISDSHEAL